VTEDLSLRERKRRRTRALLVDTGRRLFEERGYDETTVADIAAAAEIGTRTFFAYFETKEQLLFPGADPRITAALDAIATRTAAETPAQVLLRAFDDAAAMDDEMASPMAQLRLRLMTEVPPVQARAMRLQFDAQRQIAAALLASYPHLDEVEAAALVGAFIGAVAAAFQVLGDQGDVAARKRRVREAVAAVLI
jgi:AcrR family transcriptional regulator